MDCPLEYPLECVRCPLSDTLSAPLSAPWSDTLSDTLSDSLSNPLSVHVTNGQSVPVKPVYVPVNSFIRQLALVGALQVPVRCPLSAR